MLQVDVCFLCFPPGFPAVPLYLDHTSVVSRPSQNRAGAIHAHGSSLVFPAPLDELSLYRHFGPCKHAHADAWTGQWKPLVHQVELLPGHAVSLAAAVEPLKPKNGS